MSEFESSHSDIDSMPEEESILKQFHPTIGEELDPDSIQYQTMCRFFYRDINHPGPSGMSIDKIMISTKVYTSLVKDYEGPSQTTSLKVYTRDSSEIHRRIPNTRDREMT